MYYVSSYGKYFAGSAHDAHACRAAGSGQIISGMNPDAQREMIKDADYSRHDHDLQRRKLEMCRTLSSLVLNEQGYTQWFDESRHGGNNYAARVRRLPPAAGQPLTYRIQVGLAEHERVGESEDTTFVHEYGQVTFLPESEEAMKFAEVSKLVHVRDKAPYPQRVAGDSEAFGGIEYTIAQAGLHAALPSFSASDPRT